MTRTHPASTYDDDFYAWTQEQAAALRRLPPADDVDIAHVAEEIEDLGKRDLREVRSFLKLLMQHLIKINSNAASQDIKHWRIEAREFSSSARSAYAPSMRQLLDLDDIWRMARERARLDLADQGLGTSVPARCPFELDGLLGAEFDIDGALATLVGRTS